jgi:hypothetical protein
MGSAEITGRKEGAFSRICGGFLSLAAATLMQPDHRRLVNFRNWLGLVTKRSAED